MSGGCAPGHVWVREQQTAKMTLRLGEEINTGANPDRGRCVQAAHWIDLGERKSASYSTYVR
jgi:hypothetical protein